MLFGYNSHSWPATTSVDQKGALLLVTNRLVSRFLGIVVLLAILGCAQLASAASHVVVRGESLWKIGQKYGSTVSEIMRANGLVGTTIYPGQSLQIPVSDGQAQSQTHTNTSVSVSNEEFELLARMIQAEAGGEPYRGMVAVGAVILNRVRSAQFPNSISAVLYQPGQFQPVSNGWLWKVRVTSQARQAAQEALEGVDPTAGALYFFAYARVTNAWLWARPHRITIGAHRFTG